MAAVFTLATFNVKDLFDAGHAEKTATIATRIAEADPDVLGIEEVGSAAALDQVLSLLPRGNEYTTRIVAPPDRRGIANALIARVPLVAQWIHSSESLPLPRFFDSDPAYDGRIPLRRAMPHGRFAVPGLGEVDVLVAHWKSQHPTPLRRTDGSDIAPLTQADWAEGAVRALMSRAAEALFVRGLVEQALTETSRVALVGDLNDSIDSAPLRIVRALGPKTRLKACAELVPPEARYSATHAGQRIQIDHILVSPELGAALHGAQFFNAQLRDHSVLGDGPPTPDSDHALFVARFTTS